MTKRRIEITVSRRRTTIHLRHTPAGDTVKPTLHQADELHVPTLAANLPPANGTEQLEPPATELPRALLALTDGGSENDLSKVELETE